jgi:hypothetical protein
LGEKAMQSSWFLGSSARSSGLALDCRRTHLVIRQSRVARIWLVVPPVFKFLIRERFFIQRLRVHLCHRTRVKTLARSARTTLVGSIYSEVRDGIAVFAIPWPDRANHVWEKDKTLHKQLFWPDAPGESFDFQRLEDAPLVIMLYSSPFASEIQWMLAVTENQSLRELQYQLKQLSNFKLQQKQIG